MTDFEDFHNRISKRLIAATFAVAMLLDFMPFSSDGFFWLPEFTALMLPQRRCGADVGEHAHHKSRAHAHRLRPVDCPIKQHECGEFRQPEKAIR